MKLINISVSVLLALFIMTGVCEAAKKKSGEKAGSRKAKTALKEISLTGTITKSEKKRNGKTIVVYTLTTENGQKIRLPSSKKKDTASPKDFVGSKVTLAGKGSEVKKGGKTTTRISTIVSINKVEQGEDPDVSGDK